MQHRRCTYNIDIALIIALVLVPLVILHAKVTHQVTMPYLIGERGEAIFDLWSFQHFFSGILVGSILTHMGLAKLPRYVLLIIVCAFFWEAAELAMEAGLYGEIISTWKDGYEHWANRFFGDPSMVTLGSLVAYRFKTAWIWALGPTLMWLGINISSPSSMHVQRQIFGQ